MSDPTPDRRGARRILTVVLTALLAMFVVVWPQQARSDVDPGSVVSSGSESTSLTYHYPERYKPAIALLEKEGGPAIERLSEALALDAFPDVDVWLLPEVDDYFEVNDKPNRAPKWAVGLSLGDRKTVVVARDSKMPNGEAVDLEKTFVHELTHVAIDVAKGKGEVPRWFHEGYAIMLADEWTAERSDKLARAASTGSLIPMADLGRSFPAHHNVASLAYAQSFHFVRYLEQNYGREAIAETMRDVREGRDFGDALGEATGQNLAAIQSSWRESITENTSWLAILREDTAIFFGAILIFVIGYMVQRRRKRRRMDEMDDEPEDWSYDKSRYPLPGESNDS